MSPRERNVMQGIGAAWGGMLAIVAATASSYGYTLPAIIAGGLLIAAGIGLAAGLAGE